VSAFRLLSQNCVVGASRAQYRIDECNSGQTES